MIKKRRERKSLSAPPLHRAILDPLETRGNRSRNKAQARNKNNLEVDYGKN